MNKKMIWIWLSASALAVIYFFFTLDQLPERVAVHFDAFGNPNGFQSKGLFQSTFLSFIFIMNGLFAILFLFITRLPVQLFNIPHKQFWLSKPELKEEFYRRIQAIPPVMGIFINVVFLITEHIIDQANIPDTAFRLPPAFAVVAIFAALGILLLFLTGLFKPPKGG